MDRPTLDVSLPECEKRRRIETYIGDITLRQQSKIQVAEDRHVRGGETLQFCRVSGRAYILIADFILTSFMK